MSSENFQTTYTKIAEVGHSILKYLQSFRNEKLSEGDDTKSLQSVENDIHTALTALKEQRYEVAVVAPMKAGKSTFLNAIIGAEVLASETAACTVCRTDISHINENQTPELLEYREGRRKPISLAKGSVNEIQQKFLERTREFRSDKNSDKEFPTSFELRYSIEAISGLSSLAGLRLIDTPGPNEWKSMSVDVVKLKQSTLEALRNCNAVLFVLNYRSFKDNAVDELFQSITENRKELLGESKARIYFILNQIDLRSEKDPEISETISSLKTDLEKFGFPEPSVYPVSALQGLYAKSIHKGIATEQQKKDFKKFFSARYARENEDGDLVIPKPEKIAPQAIEDSGIIAIQEAIFQRIIKEAGWNLLDDVLEKLKKAATAIEDTLNTRISGWEMEISTLKQRVEEYKKLLSKQINHSYSPYIQSWWIDTQDRLIREGSKIREQLKQRIHDKVQAISNELSSYLGDALEVELNINPIQFPDFEFRGIDTQIKYQQAVYQRMNKEIRKKSCCSSETYEVNIPVTETSYFYEVNLKHTEEQIKQAIDDQVQKNKNLLQQVIEKQIKDDFKNAETQINDYINRFQSELELLLKDRERKEYKTPEIIDSLKAEKERLSKYLKELQDVREFLNSWKQS
jgi:GTPase Era involved in 16S rRNA processing